MKLLIKKLVNSDLSIQIRNLINYKPVEVSIKDLNFSTISDAFCWRTDNDFETVFNYSDILNLFYKINDSLIEIEFFTKNNELIKKIELNKHNYSNKIKINSDFLNGIEDYGTFYIYHRSNNFLEKKIIISNRCYVGFSKNKCLHSFVHGNTLARYKQINTYSSP